MDASEKPKNKFNSSGLIGRSSLSNLNSRDSGIHNVTEGELSGILRNSENVPNHGRTFLSSIKKTSSDYVPRKISISPINLQEMLKQLEESDDEDDVAETEKLDSCSIETTKNNVTENSNMTKIRSRPIDISIMKENFDQKKKEKNNSFDLDFSTLSVNTPNKKHEAETVFATPNMANRNLIPKEKEYEFVIPKVTTQPKIQYSAKKEYLLSTPFRNSNQLAARQLVNEQNFLNKPKVEKNVSTKEKSFDISNNSQVQTETITKIVPSVPENKKIIKVNNTMYEVMNMLGKGGSSEVFLCCNMKNNQNFAVKCVSLSNPATANGYINEVRILQRLQNCKQIIKMEDFEIVQSEKKLLVVLEKGGEDLSTILKHLSLSKFHISMHMLLFYWMEMLYAVKEIHSNGIIHSDLKPANFLQAEGGIKLIDFGIATCIQNDMTSVFKSNPEGSCNYISPEALNNETSTNINSPNYGKNKYKINFKSDVWSLGIILYQLVYGRTPFQHINQLWPKLTAILDPNHRIEYPDAPWVSPRIINTIKACLQFTNRRRPSIDELIAEYQTNLLTF